MRKLLIPILAIVLSGCANFQSTVTNALGPPERVQADITYLAGRAKPYINADAQAKIHNFAVALNTTANLDLTALYALLPSTTGSITGDLLMSTAKVTLQAAVGIYGPRNPTAIAYAHAVANGLLANFGGTVMVGYPFRKP